MKLRPRDCLTHFHLIILAGLVGISLILIIVGGTLPAWCIRYVQTFECHSLFNSERAFSCLFKLVPTAIIFCLILSLFTFVILIVGQVNVEYSGVAKKEYQFVARFINILALSMAIILIMVVLLQWFHPPEHASKNIRLALIPLENGNSNRTSATTETPQIVSIFPDDPSYLKAMGIERQPISAYRQRFNHGPNLFFSAFLILFIALLGFAIGHRLVT